MVRCCSEDRFFLLNELIDNQLNHEQEQTVRAHIECCPYCAREYAALKSTVELLHYLNTPEGSEIKKRIYASLSASVHNK